MDDLVVVSIGVRANIRAQQMEATAGDQQLTTSVRTQQVNAQQVSGRFQEVKVRVQQVGTQQVEAEVRIQQSRKSSIQQSEDKLDQEIELIRKLMVKVSQKKIAARKQRTSSNKRKKERECKSAASGARKNKIWKPGGMQKKNIAVDDQLQTKVWDPGRQE